MARRLTSRLVPRRFHATGVGSDFVGVNQASPGSGLGLVSSTIAVLLVLSYVATWKYLLPNVLLIEQAWVLETVGQRDRKTFILNPNRRRSC